MHGIRCVYMYIRNLERLMHFDQTVLMLTGCRRWFIIQSNQLVYRKRSKDTQTIMEEDLRLCTAKKMPDIDRRFCFELISPRGSVRLSSSRRREGQCSALAPISVDLNHLTKILAALSELLTYVR